MTKKNYSPKIPIISYDQIGTIGMATDSLKQVNLTKKDSSKIPENKTLIAQAVSQELPNNFTSISKKNYYNKIFFGPPGTGKSYKVAIDTNKSYTERVTFHAEYSYYDFVGQYKPVVILDYKNPITTSPGGFNQDEPAPVISYSFVPGIFIDIYVKALQNPDKEIFLIIEEINRGNCAAIFGDIFQLLDRNEKGSIYPIKCNPELKNYLKSKNLPSEILNLPPNLKIVATMNTSDQSLFPMDSAFKRRWQMEYCSIEEKNEELKDVIIESTNIKWLDFIKNINLKILMTLNNEDKQLGQWFVENKNGLVSIEDFKYKVLSYLYYDVFKHHRDTIFKELSYSKIISKSLQVTINEIIK